MRGWSLKIGSVSGIGIYIHATFLILIGYLVWVNRQAPALQITLVVAFVCAVFACIVLHELGHALTAQRFGVRTRDITILPIGGVARLERIPQDPRQELLIAVAGPAVNVVIAAVLYAVVAALHLGFPDPAARTAPATGSLLDAIQTAGFLRTLAYTNAALVVFNLLPAFPMDGGRILRAALAYKLDYARATRIAAGVGQVMAGLFVVLGLMGNPWLVLIAIFVFMGAQAEAQAAEIRWNIGDLRVRDAMITDFLTLAPSDTLKQAADQLLAGSQQDFPVLEGDLIVGVLSRGDLMKALATRGLTGTVAESMSPGCRPVDASAPLPSVFDQMQRSGCPLIPVTSQGRLVGILTLENIGEFIMVRSALRGLPSPLRPVSVREEVRRAG
jgi:Zn-dependent protease/CBS domain-containing protein